MIGKLQIEDSSQSLTGRYGVPGKFDPNFRGPMKGRSCTDILCLFIFVSFIVGWIVIGIWAALHGNPHRLLSPTDSWGQVCGKDEAVKDKPYLLFFDITRCASPKVPFTGCPTPQICIEKCPSETWFFGSQLISNSKNGSKIYCKYNVDTKSQALSNLILNDECAAYYVHSQSVVRRCIPSISVNSSLLDKGGQRIKTANDEEVTLNLLVKSMKHLGSFLKASEIAEGVVKDLRMLWPLILVGCVIAMFISFIWICLLRVIASFMVWFSLIAFTALSGFSAFYTLNKYLKLRDTMNSKDMSETQMAFTSEFSKVSELESTWLILFIITIALFLIVLILVIFLRKRIRLAVALIGEASKAVGSIMSSLIFPVFPDILEVIVLICFCGIFFLLSSSGEPQYRVVCVGDCDCSPVKENSTCNPSEFSAPSCPPNQVSCQFFNYEKSPLITYFHIYNVFALFWLMFFISAMEEMILAGAFSSWYWAFKKPEDVPPTPLLESTSRTFRYHIGTIAFGSLIIAIVRLIRLLFEYIDHKVREHTDSTIAKIIGCCCRCCLWCLESFLRFINRNAYIYCAIYGSNFCHSGRKAFSLIMRNIARVVVLDKVTDFLLFIGKLVVTGSVAVLSFYFFSGEIVQLRDHLPEMNYYLTPVIIITVATYFIASSFFSVYEMAVDTLFFCFLEDSERNDGSPEKPFFMSRRLREILSKPNKADG